MALQIIEKSKAYLSSTQALKSLEQDPYWPKWDSPWWHMLLLHELGLAREIPKSIILKMVEVLKDFYLPIFPIRPEQIPSGTDTYRKIICHCAVGSMYQVLFDCGVDVDRELTWMRPWMLHYQLPDGGLNCDEKVYTQAQPKSSIISTLPCLEAILFSRNRELHSQEKEFLDKGAQYLLRQKLFRKVSTGEVIDKDWLEIRFPRFYDYDFLRGFYFLTKWREFSGFQIPEVLIDEVKQLVAPQMTDKGIRLKRYNIIEQRSYNQTSSGAWAMGSISEFDLMKAVSFDGHICEPLTKKWNEALTSLQK